MDSSGIRANMSAQQLLNNEVYDRTSAINASLEANSDETGGSSSLASSTNKLDIKQMSSSSASTSSTAVDARNPQSSSFSKRQLITVAILCFVNLINYMDRFTIAGMYHLNRLQIPKRRGIHELSLSRFGKVSNPPRHVYRMLMNIGYAYRYF